VSEERRERIGRDEMLTRMFEAFEKYTYWTIKGLVEHTEQSVAHVKEMLNEVGQYVRKGPRKGMYMLKPEYVPYMKKDPRQPAIVAEVAPYNPEDVEEEEEEEEEEDFHENMKEVVLETNDGQMKSDEV
jgi:transcription initiation factor TFIIF subunit beta